MKLKITPSSLAIVIALLLTLVAIELFFFNEKQQFELQSKKNNLALEQCVSKIINNEINNIVVSLKTFNLLFKSYDYNPSKFESLAEKIIATNKSISELQFAPQGIIQMTYPHSKTNSAIGHDLNRLKKRKNGVSLSIKNKSFTFIGPVKLIQNNQLAFILRLPIFDESLDFVGFIIAISGVENISKKLPFKDYLYKVDGFNPDGDMLTIFDNRVDKSSGVVNVFNVAVPNGQWVFSMKKPTYNAYEYNIIRVLLYVMVFVCLFYIYKREREIALKNTLIVDDNNMLRQVSFTDELTNIPNRRYMNEKIKQIFSTHITLTHSIAFLDIDHFKRVNDTYGHDAGDKVLKEFADICLNNVRSSDVLARWGGEEFILFLDRTGKDNAEEVCARILNTVEQHQFLFKDQVIRITTSIGLASFSPQDDQIEVVLKGIDEALYSSKNNGRNRITIV
ncbi:sensor domain-containing diguanylate cyclase [Photobacterium kishitanii]|uniref:sensor domain-containing diguanylate cyclase n=1 Tax=Photobacterium kishitanii TaxID=318456 RepID=UPI0004313197|nr:diguanylate cyclase [Photobacterium kishitanii]CEO41820.1 putative signal transduction protein. In SS9 not in 3TCK [Photobacterium kishitanii]